ncbi:Ig-like domain-containing protein [Photobacterium toruni]|uniref:Ig-like domain-containing protein n=1 Tax=Photobacterium toruni TaxID=1935446 RepID=UPI0021106DFE|nr:Ig-like domain-containing protein [Photobacterium toruni]
MINKKKLGILIALLISSTAVNAEVISIGYTDQQGEHKEAALSQEFFNPNGDVTITMSAGLDRRMRLTLKDSSDLTIATETSHVINTHDRLTVNDQTFYGVKFTVSNKLQDGEYAIISDILDLNGKLVSTTTDKITIDLAPPKVGPIAAESYGGLGGKDVPDGVWYTGVWSSNKYVVTEVSDNGAGVADIFAIVKREDGAVYKRGKVNFDSQGKTASIGNGSGWFPSNNATEIYTLQFEVHDNAGNVTYSPAQRMYYDNQIGDAKLIAVYNPNSDQEIGGIKGFEPYKPGMEVFTNPVKTMYQVPYDNFHTHARGGLFPRGESQVIDNDKGDPVYVIYVKPYGFTDGNYVAMHDQCQFGGIAINNYNLKLAKDVIKQPVRVGNSYEYSDIGWSSWNRKIDVNEMPVKILASKINAQARPYDQFFEHMGNCTIPAGNTSCIITYDPPKVIDKGTIGNWHYGSSLTNKDGSLFSQPGWASVHWNNSALPVITSTEWDPSTKIVTVLANQPSRGYYFDSVRITDAYLNSDGKKLNVPRTKWEESSTNYKFAFDLSKLPDGLYDIDAVVMEAHRNFATKNVVKFTNDAQSPQITIDYNGQPVKGMVRGINGLTVNIKDISEFQILDITLKGGPSKDNIYLAYRNIDKNKIKIEQPRIFPAMIESQQYILTVRAKDAFGNIGTSSVKFTYTPDNWIKLKAVTALPISRKLLLKNDKPAAVITSSVLHTDSGNIATGPQEGIVTVRSDASFGVIINDQHVSPGETEHINFNLQGDEGKLEIPIYPDDNVKDGHAEFMFDVQQLRSLYDK